MGAVSSVLHPVAHMELSCQRRIWGHRGKRQGCVLAFAVRPLFQRLAGASHPAPVGHGSCEPPGILLK